MRLSARVTTGIHEAMAEKLSLALINAISDTPEEANLLHASHCASVDAQIEASRIITEG